MTSNAPVIDQIQEPAMTDFATELTAAADDAIEILATRSDDGSGLSNQPRMEQSINLQTILRIPVTMKVVVGSVTMPVAELKKLRKGDTVALDRRVGEVVDIVVNGQIVARGMLVIVDGESARLGVSLREIVEVPSSPSESGYSRKE